MSAIDGGQHEVIEPPPCGAVVWDAFWSLDGSRQFNGRIPQAIPHTEVHAWTQLFQQRLQAWEVNAIRAMDGAYLKAIAQL